MHTANEERACIIMTALWSQLAAEFAGYDEHLIFEGQNEPRKIGTPLEWNGGDEEGWEVVNSTNAAFVKAVRQGTEYNKSRYLMIPGYAANCTVGIRHIDIPDDDRIIISVHAYEPYDFALNTEGRSQWQHDTQMIDSFMTELRERFTGKGIPVIIGEFGAMNKDNEADRAEWVEYYIKAASKAGIRCIWWDNGLFEGEGERFGLFDRHTYPHLSGRGSYLVSVAANGIFGRIGRHWTVWLDEERIEDDFALVSMCNGRYYGGGSTPVPEARMNDGVLHTVLVKNISKLRFARLFPDYSAGNHEKLPKDVVRFSTAKVVRIHSDDGDIVTCLDGECSHSHDVTLRLADKKLNFFGPAGCDPNATAR